MGKFSIIVTAIIVILAGTWWFFREPMLKVDEIRITYDHGETCLLKDWSFRIRRKVTNNSGRGETLKMNRHRVQQVDDTDLRVFSPTGEKLLILRKNLRQIELMSSPDLDYDGYNQVISLTLSTAADTIVFDSVELPGFSRSRVLVPVASHFFPEQNDEYMTWGNIRMTLAGTVQGKCSTNREIHLTDPSHAKSHTPVLIEFAGK